MSEFGKWEPIDTAPKDGTNVLLGYLDVSGKFGVRSAYYVPDIHFGRTKEPAPVWVCNMDKIIIDQRATHWQPLTPPPAE